MKSKLKEFVQHLYHEIENEEAAEKYLDEALPLIGFVVMWFNGLEAALDSILCENFTDRSDSTGLIVLNKMNYSAKVDLFKRFSDDFHATVDTVPGYDELIDNLRESGRLRNLIVHANWEATNEEGYTYIRFKISKKGMHQEYVQFNEESLHKIIELVFKTREDLHKYWETRNEILHNS